MSILIIITWGNFYQLSLFQTSIIVKPETNPTNVTNVTMPLFNWKLHETLVVDSLVIWPKMCDTVFKIVNERKPRKEWIVNQCIHMLPLFHLRWVIQIRSLHFILKPRPSAATSLFSMTACFSHIYTHNCFKGALCLLYYFQASSSLNSISLTRLKHIINTV